MRKFWTLMLVSVCLYSCREESVKSKDELLKAITPAVQQKIIDPSIDNLIGGEKGVRVFIPANSLVFEDGTKATGQVTVNLEEFLSASDFFSRKLSTVSGSDLLETGGMINITATSGGKSLRVDGAEAIVVALPATDTLPGMETFYGSFNDSSSGAPVNWIASNQLFGDAGPGLDSSVIDSSLYSYTVTACGYVNMINDKPITWRIRHSDSTVFRYIPNNMDSLLKNRICESGTLVEVIVAIDSMGTVTDVMPGYTNPQPALTKILLPFFKNMPRFDMSSMYEHSTDGVGGYNLTLCCDKQIDPVKYKERFEKKYAPYKDKALKAIGKTEISFYLLTSKNLGWINCDRFYNDPAPKTDFVVTTTGVTNPQVMLVFENIKSVMQAEEKDGRFIFRNIPVNSKVKVVSTGEGKDMALLAVQSTTVSTAAFKLEGYTSFSLNEFQQKLK